MPKSTQECIREMAIRGRSQRKIASALGVSRNTVAKYASAPLSPGPPVRRARESPTMEPYADLVRGRLASDLAAPPKQRHTARRVFDRLVGEEGFRGSPSTVERFVRGWGESRPPAASEGFLELSWPAGSAQGDYGVAPAVIGGVEERVHELVISLPHSNARWASCSMSGRSECLCESMLAVFEHIGGVPPVLVLDNATEAGRRLAGVVRESSLFSAFRQHRGFTARFCNPHSGHGKGSVENAVGFLRRNLMVPVPEAPGLGALNARLLAGCDAPLDRERCREGVPVRQLLAEDAAALPPLPGARFDCVRWERRRADREGRVEVDGTLYCAGPRWHGRWMLVGLRAGTVEVMDERGRSAATLPRSWSGGGATVFDPATLIPAVTARPRSWEQSQLRSAVPPSPAGAWRSATASRRGGDGVGLSRGDSGGGRPLLAHQVGPRGVGRLRDPEAEGVPARLPRGGGGLARRVEARAAAQALRPAAGQVARRLRLVGGVVAGGLRARRPGGALLRRPLRGPRADGRRRHGEDAPGVRAGGDVLREGLGGPLLHRLVARAQAEAREGRGEAGQGAFAAGPRACW